MSDPQRVVSDAQSVASGRHDGIDAGRFLAFVGVVLIHSIDMGGPLAFWFAAWGRFAVPMFFIVSGYFLSNTAPALRTIRKFTLRFWPIFIFWALAYLVIYAAWPVSLRDWAMLLIKGGRGNHLWFIPSLWLCLVTYVLLQRWMKPTWILAVAALLYVVGLGIGSYAPVIGVEQSFWNPRDGLMFGLIFVSIGAWLRVHPPRMPLAGAVAMFAVLSVVHGLEYYAVAVAHPEYVDFFVTTPVFAVSAFLVVYAWQPRTKWSRHLVSLGRFSLGFYAIHMFFINLTRDWLPHDLRGWALSIPLVIFCSVGATLLLAQVKPLRRFIQ